jgi:hypothetical protein
VEEERAIWLLIDVRGEEVLGRNPRFSAGRVLHQRLALSVDRADDLDRDVRRATTIISLPRLGPHLEESVLAARFRQAGFREWWGRHGDDVPLGFGVLLKAVGLPVD